jgi:hypothetical protein
MRIAIATYAGKPPQFTDDEVLVGRLRELGADAELHPWDSREADWASFDLVVARSPWDYSVRHDEFLAWTDRVGGALENAPELIRWNSDKRYLADLGAAGVPVVETTYVGPGDAPPAIDGEIVIKPTVSGGARNTGRFGPRSATEAHALIARITAEGRTAMVQPFVATVEEAGETAVVTVDGAVSHVLRKGAILRADEVAPIREDDELGVAEVMYDPELVVPGGAEPDELALAQRTLEAIRERFGVTPLVARVDMLRSPEGAPLILELEAIEPNLYFDQIPKGVEVLAHAILRRARALVLSRPAG